jgi:hypothetical protein
MDIVQKFDASGKSRTHEAGFNEGRGVVRVAPKNEHIRRVLRHGVTKVGFLAEGEAEWPNDSFTRRRIREGDVIVVAAPQVEPEAQQTETHVEKSAGRKQPAPDKT